MIENREKHLKHNLKQVFGYDAFRSGQLEVIDHLLNGHDVVSIMPTGAGKSLCFQLPALLHNFQTIIVSPLVALMNDQTAALKGVGVDVELIHSGRSYQDNATAWRSFASGGAKMLYLSPERLMQERMLAALQAQKIGMFVIDEAHCISKWGAGFRPDYEALSRLKDLFPNVIIGAFTATADHATRIDISEKLTKGRANIIVKGFDRPNLSLVVNAKKNLKADLLSYVSKRAGQSGIVYCLSRRETDDITTFLREQGINALAYHAGKSMEFRTAAQKRFMSEDNIVMVATIAFGMGIDKPDIRFVVHASLPASVEAFYQEIGRAGRDGMPSDTALFYGLSDLIKRQRMIFEGDGTEQFKLLEYRRLEYLIGYCETVKCRKAALLSYFDEESEPCGHCDNCINPPIVVEYTAQARMVLEAVEQTGQFFGASYIIDLVRGAETSKIIEKKHHDLTAFGAGKSYTKSFFQTLIRQLVSSGILKVNLEKYGAIQLTRKAAAIGAGTELFFGRSDIEIEAAAVPKKVSDSSRFKGYNPALFQVLKVARLTIAQQKDVPAYMIFSDSTLKEMALRQPVTEQEFLSINGIGHQKFKEYFERFTAIIQDWQKTESASFTPHRQDSLSDGL